MYSSSQSRLPASAPLSSPGEHHTDVLFCAIAEDSHLKLEPWVMGNLGGLGSIVKRGGACGWRGGNGKPRESVRRDPECFSPPGPLGWYPGPSDFRGIGGAQPGQ
ncbi:hypothetical protein PAL_GLEAN10003682 [Pteropus alecto]|uniref:Uncharacterized protein n=1 Tax=Pteropus alecto TaxID=9402 RepID=L5K4L3_PTEAL|nr:hypothetical protein PAL_GLEAN10003682 [Pteropus alecto]